MSNSQTYRKAVEELIENQLFMIRTTDNNSQKKTHVLGDYSDDVCEKAVTFYKEEYEDRTILTLKVYHMPKTQQEWTMFNEYMKLFHADPKEKRKFGLEQEKLRTKMQSRKPQMGFKQVKPNSLLFALQLRVEK